MIRHAIAACLALLLVAGCSASLDDNPSERCGPDGQCSAGRSCERGFCIDEIGPDGGAPLPPCDRGDTRCGTHCVSLESSFSHCGGCGLACSAGERCRRAQCEND